MSSPNALKAATALWLTRTLGEHATAGINCMVRLLKQVVNKAAGRETTEAYPCGTSQGGTRLRTKLGEFSAAD